MPWEGLEKVDSKMPYSLSPLSLQPCLGMSWIGILFVLANVFCCCGQRQFKEKKEFVLAYGSRGKVHSGG